MFDFKRAYHSALAAHPDDPVVNLPTPWGARIDPDAVLGEYPRPTMQRDSYLNLNGYWDYRIVSTGTGSSFGPRELSTLEAPACFEGRILVPFSPEAALSGVGRHVQPDEVLWYRRTLDNVHVALGAANGHRVLLHFQAVDHAMACFVNGALVGTHEGGYLPFHFDITDALRGHDDQLCICVADPSERGTQPRGKQKIDRGTIWYTAQSGIWQTVWMEAVPALHIASLQVNADPDAESLHITAQLSYGGAAFALDVTDGANALAHADCATKTGQTQMDLDVDFPSPRLWSPDDPHCYHLALRYGDDQVQSYCAFRTFTVEPDDTGIMRFCLNHTPLFLRGVLDQGYWSDSLMTAPSDDALRFDIEQAKALGFNMMRKHIKVESERWYHHCDTMGMIVWQDMVSGGGCYPAFYTSQLPTLSPLFSSLLHDTRGYERFGSADEEHRRTWLQHSLQIVEHLRNHPSIGTWVIFNEGWGQFDAARVTHAFRAADPTRPLDQASGWFDQGGGDYSSVHNYFRTLKVPRGKRQRATVISEFGGLAWHVDGHSAIARAYGYGSYDSSESLSAAVANLLAQADTLREGGLSGFVYTQLTDVEEEVNGLITYDRRQVKVHLSPPAHDVG